MADNKAAQAKGTDTKAAKLIEPTAALSPDDLGKVPGGINPQPIPPGKSRPSPSTLA